jgi:hypothetical protein
VRRARRAQSGPRFRGMFSTPPTYGEGCTSALPQRGGCSVPVQVSGRVPPSATDVAEAVGVGVGCNVVLLTCTIGAR